ncbi:MAG: acylphosphatase [Candidatus Omnitrophica bacterium]|nr:acylphosphatase [Candidatus Omnitrophota bacterium]
MERCHIFVKGKVQQVGFRFYARGIASETGIAGWVKNLPDGRVEIVAEGENEQIENFLQKLNEGCLGKNISEIVKKTETHSGEFTSFSVAF